MIQSLGKHTAMSAMGKWREIKEPVKTGSCSGDEIVHALTQDAQKRNEVNYLAPFEPRG